MLSFKNNQNVEPLYDYYIETDLDTLDDQPVDYSKKYSEKDTYEEYERGKSVLKSELSPETSQTLKQTSNDEVKVYCIEGTPLTISYASSLSDLREVGTSNLVDKSEDKHDFLSVNDDGISDTVDIGCKKNIELLDSNNEDSPLSKEKEDIKEGKSVSFRNSTDISKASSPLMFSRSSSIGSLTSFEQQSIIDDRSSVSVFSALTSGLISPSDLPDSPGELMSPTLTDKDNNSKIDVTKVDSDNEVENNDLEKKDDIHLKQDREILPETKMLSSLDLNKNSEDDNEVSDIQLETSNDSLDEVFQNPDIENNASFPLKNEKIESKITDPLKSDEDSDEDDELLLQRCIQLGMPENKPDRILPDPKLFTKPVYPLQSNPTNYNCKKTESKTVDPLKPYEDSDDDDDDDALLENCIKLAMPENSPNKITCKPEVFSKPVYLSHSNSSCYKNEKVLENKPCIQPDDDLDNDDIILQQCIEQGMPKKSSVNMMSSFTSKSVECCTASMKLNAFQQYPLKDRSKSCQPLHPSVHNIISPQCQQYRMAPKINYNNSINHKPLNVRQPSPLKKNVYRKPYTIKSDTDYDCDDNDLILPNVIEMRMSKDSSEKKSLHPGMTRRTELGSSPFVFHHDVRDNCPDGISDGDEEDDDILENCIKAGMPSPKLTHNVPPRLSVLHAKHMFQKQQMTSQPVMSRINSESNKNCNSIKLPPNQSFAPVHSNGIWISNSSFIDVDSMRVYCTEDTPVLSPTASVSDLSSLSINESFLNNSRNSDCSESDDDDDELLQQCIRYGMPEAKRAVA